MNLTLPESLSSFDFQTFVDDFRGLDPNPGNWPLAPRIASLIGLFALILLAFWWFDWSDQSTQLAAKQQEEVSLKEEFLNKKGQAINLPEYRKQLADIDRAFGALLKQLPNRSEMEALLIDINQAGLGRGLQFDLFKPGAEVMKDFYAEMPITVSLSGSYHDLGAFAADVAKLPRIVTLSDVNLDGSKEGGLLKMDAVATTYRYLDDEEMAKMRKQKAEKAAKK